MMVVKVCFRMIINLMIFGGMNRFFLDSYTSKNYNPGYLTVYKADRPEFLKVPGAACPRNNIGPRAGHLGCWILGIYLDTLYTKLGLRQAALGT